MKLNALVVDDDPIICDLIDHFCSKSGLVNNCIQANNATDGLASLHAKSTDIIFLDFDIRSDLVL